MKKYAAIASIASLMAVLAAAPPEAVADADPFVTTWRTTNPGESVTIPTYVAFGEHTIDWGDGTAPTTDWFDQTHVYEEPGTYTVSITGDFTQIRLYDDWVNAARLVSIDSWGDMRWATMDHAFGAASNMRYNATDAPDFSALTSLQYMFYSATSFNGDISGWDVSSVTDMRDMFNNADSFNGDLSGWDVSGVEDMHGMFFGTAAFNGDLSGWDVSSVTDMSGMFTLTDSFNQPLDDWDVSSVTDMNRMFLGASSFNQPLSNWNVSSVTDMTDMFSGAGAFDQNLGNWYVALDSTSIDYDDAPGIVGRISAQNSFLDGQNPVYGMGTGGDSGSFELDGSNLVLKVAPAKGTYTVTVTSTGGFGSSNSKTFDVSVTSFNTPPSVDAGADRTVAEGSTVALNGTATDQNAGDTLTYLWSHNSTLPITLADQNAVDTAFAAPNVAADIPVTFTLTVSDGTATVSDTFTLTIADSANAPPAVDAGADRTVQEGDTVTLDGTASDADAEDTLTYLWSHNSTLPITLADQNAVDTAFAAPNVAADIPVTFTLTVSDGTATVSDTFTLTIADSANAPPAVDAGADRTVQEGDTVTLDGTASDANGDSLTYLWSHNSTGLTIALANQTDPLTTFTAPQVTADTAITFTLAVSDGTNQTVTDQVQIVITDTAPPSTAFVTTWRTTQAGEGITIPVGGATGAYTVYWGDGAVSTGVVGNQTHVYTEPGSYTVSITGNFTQMRLHDDTANAKKLLSIDRWGDIRWESMNRMFSRASNMVYNATDTPDLSTVTDLQHMFHSATSFNGDISNWDVSQVTDMTAMFASASSFNGDISNWDVSQVTEMSRMFYDADSFNGDLSGWNVSQVTDTSRMFSGASSFNGDLSGWNVSQVTDTSRMFSGASSFNQPLNRWDVSQVTDMTAMFASAPSFNGDLSGWDVSQVTDMTAMFAFASSFNRDLSGWNVSQVTSMNSMFDDADSFNGDISDWDVSSVTDMSDMFYNADSFKGDLSDWDVSSVTNMFRMFLRASSFNSDISSWDVSAVDNMSSMFAYASSFKQNLGSWYIVLGNTSIDYDEAPGVVGRITSQNSFLDRQNPAYRIGAGGDSDSFEMQGDRLRLKTIPTKSLYNVTVTATGDFGRSNSKVVEVAIAETPSNWLPAVDAGADQSVREGQTVTLNGTATDTDGDRLTYEWTHDSDMDISFANATSPSTTFTAPQVDTDTAVTFTLAVSDGTDTATDQVAVTIIDNAPPTIDAGADRSVTEGDTVTLSTPQ